jgi:hypothetical protein
MRYEPYRMAKNEELHVIVYRRLIAAIDWVECLCKLNVDFWNLFLHLKKIF